MQPTSGSARPVLERPVVRGVIAAVLLAIMAGVLLAVQALGGGSGGPSLAGRPTPSSTLASDAGLGPLDDRAPIKGQPAPDFALQDADGNTVRLSDLRGNVVWVNFWATWCEPCKKELPDIQKLFDEKRSEGLVVLPIDWQESGERARDFFAQRGLAMTPLLDKSGDVYDQYKLKGLPDSFFIGRDGNLAAVYYGELNEDRMRQKLADAGLP